MVYPARSLQTGKGMLDCIRNEVNTSFVRPAPPRALEGKVLPVSARYERPESLAEALPLLAAGGWGVLAGGTDVYPAHVGRPLPQPLLDITAIEGLRGIRRAGDVWTIGAATTWTDVLRAELPPCFDALKQAAREIRSTRAPL